MSGFGLFFALLFMCVPVLNIIVGAFCFGPPGFFAGFLITALLAESRRS
jgi:hypothetical protein